MRYRTASLDDLRQALDWAASEGWNPGLDDAAAFYAADPDGFFVAEVAGAPVAAISVVNHSDSFAFLGLYLCRPDYRGQGIGYGLWQHALAHAGDRTVGLDGVAAQEANYAKSGFTRTGATMRFIGTLAPQPHPLVRALAHGDRPDLHRLDAAANGISRPAFLNAWLNETETRKTVVLGDGRAITGFATARLCRSGVKIGPIIAERSADALALAAAALAALGTEPTEAAIDLPAHNVDLRAMLNALGFENTFTTARMYKRSPPQTGAPLQAIATMELG